MGESVEELKESLKNARNLNARLNEVVKQLSKRNKQEKDEDLHAKMDKILEKLKYQEQLRDNGDYLKEELKKTQGYLSHFVESHEELKNKMEILRDDVKKIAEEVGNSRKMGKIHGTFKPTEGNAELFAKKFDGIHAKLEELKGELSSEMRQIKQQIQRNPSLEKDAGTIGEKHLPNFGHKVESNRGFNNFTVRQDALEGETEGKIERILKELADSKEEIQRDLMAQTVKIEECKNGMDKITSYFGITEPILICWNWNCNRVLPKDLPRREDGVSVSCSYCKSENIVEILRSDHKWIDIDGCDCHFQQLPMAKINGNTGKCQICGREGELEDANDSMALRKDFKCVLKEIENRMKRMETNLKMLSDPALNCWNCKSVLPKNLPIREDEVSVKCSKCEKLNIVGRLRSENKWMKIHVNFCDEDDDVHYLQFPSETKEGGSEKCSVCGTEDQIKDANQEVALHN